jgi:mycobactin salicyl-AMP ligase
MNTLTAPQSESPQGNGRLSPAGLLRRRAQQTPYALALLDPPNRQEFAPSGPRRLSFGEADTAVEALAAYFAHLGLAPGDCVAIQLPNLVESPLTLLAAWRAGLTVAAVPMLWRATELARVCEMLEPAGLIGMSSYAGERPASLLRDVAATRLSIPFVMGFGPDLPDGVSSLDDAILDGPTPGFVPRANPGPALITFTARAGEPLVPVFRKQEDILLQGAMTVMALSLDRHDILLNPYPLTGPVGIAMGLAPWLIGGTALVQNDPFDADVFVQQLLTTGATATALPDTVLDRMAEDGIFSDPQCVLRHVGRVWSVPKLRERVATDVSPDRGGFDLYPLGDLACLIETDKAASKRGTLPAGVFQIADDEEVSAFLETRLVAGLKPDTKNIAVRGPLVPKRRPAEGAMGDAATEDPHGFVKTGLFGETNGDRIRVSRDSELIYHGGFTIAASELDGLYQAFLRFLDAACFTLPDPVLGDRIFAAVVPNPSMPVSLAELCDFLEERSVASYKFPEKLLIVRSIPRDARGRIERDQILKQI